jgi:hypothetical protein
MSKLPSRKLNVVAALASVGGTLVAAGSAMASQGPGVMPGTVGASLQLAMAIVVYGGCALLIAAGLFGAVRRRRRV